MAIVGSVFAMLGRFAGRLLNSALGWATLLLFGRVEGRRQTILLVIALGSLVWVLVVLGIVFPDVGLFLLAFVPVPDFVDEGIVRLVMLGLALVIPLAVGVAAIFVADPSTRPSGTGIVAAVLRGYPFTFVLALTIVLLAAVAIVRKVNSLARRWEDAHVPIVAKPGGYDRVLADLESVLDEAGIDVERRPASIVLSVPPRLLDGVAGKALGGLVPDRLMNLVGRDLEILVYPSDVAIAADRTTMARARAAIATRLTTSPAYLTTSAEAERVEDDIRSIADLQVRPQTFDVLAVRDRLREVDRKIATLSVPFDEWETVYRERLQVERDFLSRMLASAERSSVRGAGSATAPRPPMASAGWRAVAALGFGLIALDIGLLVANRLSGSRRGA